MPSRIPDGAEIMQAANKTLLKFGAHFTTNSNRAICNLQISIKNPKFKSWNIFNGFQKHIKFVNNCHCDFSLRVVDKN